jgi:hypothetical protein
VKVLLDECVDRRFAHDLVGHEVNPFLTISALTERIVENIVASLTH